MTAPNTEARARICLWYDGTALEAAEFASVRGKFSFNTNHYPIQDFHMLTVVKRDDGKYATSFVRKVVSDYKDSLAQDCKM